MWMKRTMVALFIGAGLLVGCDGGESSSKQTTRQTEAPSSTAASLTTRGPAISTNLPLDDIVAG